MSYDYPALVKKISSHRRRAYGAITNHEDNPSSSAVTIVNVEELQQAVDAFASLSQHCPMTPLLWMQYAHDNGELVKRHQLEDPAIRLETLELGLAEFPGCALLRLHYLQLLVKHHQTNSNSNDSHTSNTTIMTAFQDALRAVGNGSHRNEGELVASVYRICADFLVTQHHHHDDADAAHAIQQVFLQRARTPLREANDAILEEVRSFCQDNNITIMPNDIAALEEARRWTSKTFGRLQTWEDEVDAAMHAEGILTRHVFPHDDMDWTRLLLQEDASSSPYWMGLGGAATARAFQGYAQTCARYRTTTTRHTRPREDTNDDENDMDDGDDHSEEDEEEKERERAIQSLASAIYERGVSECPTVEYLWCSYVKYLLFLVKTQHAMASVSQLQNVCHRAMRNCPYSVALVQLRLQAMLVLAEAGQAVLDPDAILQTVDQAVKAKFFSDPSQYLEVYMAAIQTIKRRILSLLCTSTASDTTIKLKYDEAEPLSKKSSSTPSESLDDLSDAAEEEVQDLVEELRDMYDSTDEFLRKEHNAWSEGRTLLWKDRARTEAFLLDPLTTIFSGEDTGAQESTEKKALRCFDKLVRVHQPPHPDSYAAFIHAVMNKQVSSPGQVIQKLRTVRSLYHKAISSVGKPKEGATTTTLSSHVRDRQTALHCLCHDFLEFEKLFGSEDGYTQASKTVQKKLSEVVVAPSETKMVFPKGAHASESDAGVKRKLGPGASTEEPTAKRAKPLSTEEPTAKRTKPTSTEEDVSVTDDTKASKEVVASTTEKKTEQHHPVHKVRIGKMDYPAHPFTVRVTNLALETQDMDLVDVFRPKCGAVVHARIAREKHHHPGKAKSKGWGLLQFEEREAVEKALELNDVVGVHEKIIQVGRSHVPAVGLVPPGMHRVNPKGEGKSSKRNQKRREQKGGQPESTADAAESSNAVAKKKETNAAADGKKDESRPVSNSILAFRPRGVAHGVKHRKVKLNIASDDSKKES